MITFRELLNTEGYAWDLYFYHLETRKRSSLEEVLLQSYHTIKKTKNIEQCCCDDTPVSSCGPECCPQVHCSYCNTILRICKDAWFLHEDSTLCITCKNNH